MDKAAIEAAKLNLEFTKIVSPLNGVTGVRLVDAGNLVRSSDQTGIVVITQVDPISVIFSLPQDDLPAVSKEMRDGQLTVEAYIGDKVCGSGTTEFVGDGDSRVTVYAIDVVSKEQTAGCGGDGLRPGNRRL